MTEWRRRRFWTKAAPRAEPEGWSVLLDDRPLRTPAKAPLVLPTEALARAVAGEWQAQDDEIEPLSMPHTRSANTAIDRVAPQHDEVVEIVAAYGETDLICHRAEGPDTLSLRQAEAWDPLLDWARSGLQAPLTVTTGIVPVAQPAGSLAALGDRVAAEDAFGLAALHDLVALSGSLVIGLAAIDGVLPVEELWRRSRIDETWQESQWGVDEEAAAAATRRREDFLHAARFYGLSRRAA
jgi:chaperone required for assembly of F1-ATPase